MIFKQQQKQSLILPGAVDYMDRDVIQLTLRVEKYAVMRVIHMSYWKLLHRLPKA